MNSVDVQERDQGPEIENRALDVGAADADTSAASPGSPCQGFFGIGANGQYVSQTGDETLTKPRLTQSSVEDAVRSGQRSAQAHDAFASDTARLVFGRLASGRIAHISRVERGLAASAYCPACSERLIARQGRKKAWHFAHANGHACRDALSATLAAWLAQCLQEGSHFQLPAIETRWGQTRYPDLPPQLMTAEKAVPDRASKNAGPYQVLAQSAQGSHPLRIVFRTASTSQVPGIAELSRHGVSALLIDIYTPLSERFSSADDANITEEWLTRCLLSEAPREWLWTAREAARRDILRRQRLSAHLAASADLDALTGDGGRGAPTMAEQCLERHGLIRLSQTERVLGDRFLGPWSSAWRAAIVRDLLLDPFQSGLSGIPLRDAAFGRKKIVASIARNALVLKPGVHRPLAQDDEIELRSHVPDLQRPIDIVESFLAQLSRSGALMTSSRKARHLDLPRSAIMPALDGIPDADWVASEGIMRHAMRVAAAERLLRT